MEENKKTYGHYVGTQVITALNNYEALTVQQLATFLGYSVDYMYSTLSAMQSNGVITSDQIAIYAPASKLYRLNKGKITNEVGSDTIRLILSNQFVCEGIFAFYNKENQGFIEWLGRADAKKKYTSSNENNPKNSTVSPQAYLEFQNENGRVFAILETILETENKDEIRTKMEQYITRLREMYNEIEKIHLFILVNSDELLSTVVEMWNRLTGAPPFEKKIPTFYAVNFNSLAEEGFLGSCWFCKDKKLHSISEFKSLDLKDIAEESYLGKKRKGQTGWNFKPLIANSPMVRSLSNNRSKKKNKDNNTDKLKDKIDNKNNHANKVLSTKTNANLEQECLEEQNESGIEWNV